MPAATFRFALALGALLLAGPAPAARADTYTLDRQHTEIRFSWNHLGLSRQSGEIRDFEGTVEFDPEKPETGTVSVVMRLASLSTGVPELDKHLLQTRDFFDLQAHPTISFKSTSAKALSDRTGEVVGDLTINGVTRPATLQVTWNYTGEHPLAKVNPTYGEQIVSGFSATARILRSEWGIKRTIPLVSDEIQISIEAEMIRKAR